MNVMADWSPRPRQLSAVVWVDMRACSGALSHIFVSFVHFNRWVMSYLLVLICNLLSEQMSARS